MSLDLSRATSVQGPREAKRGAVQAMLDAAANGGTLSLTECYSHPEPLQTWALEVLSDVADAKPASFGLRDRLQFRLLVGRDLVWKDGMRTQQLREDLSRTVPHYMSWKGGTTVDVATGIATLALPQFGAHIANLGDNALARDRECLLELGYELDGVYHRTVTDAAERAFRERWNLEPSSAVQQTIDAAAKTKRG